MDGPRENHIKSEKDKYHDITYVWNIKKMIHMNLKNRNRPTDIEQKFMDTKGK